MGERCLSRGRRAAPADRGGCGVTLLEYTRDPASESAALRLADPVEPATQAEVDGWLAFTQTLAFKAVDCVCGPFLGQRDGCVPTCEKHPLYTKCLCDVCGF